MQGSVNPFLPGFQEWEVECLLCLFRAVQTVELWAVGENVDFEVGHTDKRLNQLKLKSRSFLFLGYIKEVIRSQVISSEEWEHYLPH